MDDEVVASLEALELTEDLDVDRIGDGVKTVNCGATLSPS